MKPFNRAVRRGISWGCVMEFDVEQVTEFLEEVVVEFLSLVGNNPLRGVMLCHYDYFGGILKLFPVVVLR
ncbi:hypothetical protein ABEB36_009423 [Hypothenemus hampei]|uniref:Uncharacterized protein n=1 Tax=Hypothenemus hampei TaxID=57062 RepID=A0ABD1EGM7_HYPHA